MKRFIKIGEASNILGVSVPTLKRWEKQKILCAIRRKEGPTRYYEMIF